MKKFLSDLLAKRQAEFEAKQKRMQDSEDAKEVREVGETLLALRDEINSIEEQIKALDAEEESKKEDEAKSEEPKEDEEDKKEEGRSLNPLATYSLGKMEERKMEEKTGRASMEYRQAFKDYVQKGIMNPILERRDDGPSTTADLGVLVPQTVMDEIITKLNGKYGQLYNRVRHLNVKGGVDFAIGEFDFTAKRIVEGASAPTAEKGKITDKVSFGFRHCWIGASRSLLESELNLVTFENKVVEGILQAFLKKMDAEIINGQGSGSNEMEGILFEAEKAASRIDASHVITFTADEMKDWKTWREKLFAKVPLEMRAESPEFVMTAGTYEADIKTLADDSNRPVYYETYNPIDGEETSRFAGKEVVFVNEGNGISDFDTAEADSVFGIYWVPTKAYGINSNMQFSLTQWRDHAGLKDITYALVVNDGKVLNGDYVFILKKA